jgi:6-phosphofructokinase
VKRRIGILTGGGDVPGLNVVIKTVVDRMLDAGHEVLGLRRGWAALLHATGDESADRDWVIRLDKANTRTIARTGGTILHATRLSPEMLKPRQAPAHLAPLVEQRLAAGARTVDLTDVALATIERLRLSALVAIGGDGTLTFARRLHLEGVPVIGVPKTMDNDVYGTDYCIGFSTAVSRSVHYIDELRTVAGSHERFLVVELFGRESGETCLLASYLGGADRAVIAEVPYETDRICDLLAADKRANPSGYAVLCVSEGARPVDGEMEQSGEPDAVGKRRLGGIGRRISEAIEQRTGGEPVIYQRLGYLMRSGPPDSLDRLVATNFGHLAVDLLLGGQSGYLMALVGGRYLPVPLTVLGEGLKRVDVQRFYDRATYRPRVVGVEGLPMFLH